MTVELGVLGRLDHSIGNDFVDLRLSRMGLKHDLLIVITANVQIAILYSMSAFAFSQFEGLWCCCRAMFVKRLTNLRRWISRNPLGERNIGVCSKLPCTDIEASLRQRIAPACRKTQSSIAGSGVEEPLDISLADTPGPGARASPGP